MKRSALIRHLSANGGHLVREGDSHSLWVSGEVHKPEAVPRHQEIDNRLARDICRHLGIPDPPG